MYKCINDYKFKTPQMNIQPTITTKHELKVSPEVARLHQSFFNFPDNKGGTAFSSVICTSSREKGTSEKFYKFAFLTGITAAALQVTSGLSFAALWMLGGKKKFDSARFYKGKAGIAAKMAFSTLGLSYLVCAPSTMGAGVNSKQPGIVLHSVIAGGIGAVIGALTLLNRGSVGTRVKGLLSLAYAPLFAGFANKIDTDFKSSADKKGRQMNVDFTTDMNSYVNIFSLGEKGNKVRKNFADFMKFSVIDMKNSFITSGESVIKVLKQGKDYIFGGRKELPDIISMKPTRESMSLASALAVLGSIPKVIMGSKLNNKACNVADFMIGAGFLFDSLAMMSVANANNDDRKLPMLIGGPMRIVGDFRQESNLFYGLRTVGGAAFEYYYALMNKEKDGKLS